MIDISKHNGPINWAKVKADGIKQVMIRAGYGWTFKKDALLEDHVKGAVTNGIDYGLYFYSYATNMDQAKTEVAGFLAAIKAYKPTLPIVVDTEDADSWRKNNGNPSMALIADMAIYQMNEIEKAGYYAMWYTSLYWAKQMIPLRPKLKDYALWLAHWSTTMGNPGMPVSIWQYTEKGPKYGTSDLGMTDMNWVFKDYPTIIKNMNKPVAEAKEKKPVVTNTPIQEAGQWVITAGIFSSKERAETFASKAKKAGLDGIHVKQTQVKPSTTNPENGFVGTFKVTAKYALNVRSLPSSKSKALRTLSPGTVVSVSWINGTWAKMKYAEGYVSTKYLEEVK